MTNSARPENWHELMAGYALGNLSPEEAEEIQHWLTVHPELTEEMHRLQEALALMPYALPETEPPPHLRAAILEAAQTEQYGANISSRQNPLRQNHGAWWVGAAGAIAAIALMALSLDNYRLRQAQGQTQVELAQLQQQIESSQALSTALQQPGVMTHALEGTGRTPAASGSLVVSPAQQQVVVVIQNLPALPPGQAYRLWAMPSDAAKPTYCGEFTLDPTGTAAWSAPTAVCQSTTVKLLITSELANDPPIPKGPLVMQSRI